MTEQVLLGVFYAAIISIISFAVRFLTLGGAVSQFVLGSIVLGLGGWQWAVPMLAFFLFSSLLSILGKPNKIRAASVYEKSYCRDASQVFANGGVGGLIVLLWYLLQDDFWFIAYLGSVGAAAADTWETEIGTLSRSSPWLITTFRRVEPGRSGAVSQLGFVGGVLGAVSVWASALPWLPDSVITSSALATLTGAVVGSSVDSLLGATVQVQYECSACATTTERLHHCGCKTKRASGLGWISNDIVNAVCTLLGCVVSAIIFLAID